MFIKLDTKHDKLRIQSDWVDCYRRQGYNLELILNNGLSVLVRYDTAKEVDKEIDRLDELFGLDEQERIIERIRAYDFLAFKSRLQDEERIIEKIGGPKENIEYRIKGEEIITPHNSGKEKE